MSAEQFASLLGPRDPAPVEVLRPEGRFPAVLVCEHAGRAVPASLDGLGLPEAELGRHIGWDIGAEGVARRLSDALDAPLVIQRYSRLVIDCNRPADAADLIPAVSDGTAIPGNAGLDPAQRAARWAAIHAPFHAAVSRVLDVRDATPVALLAVHSFTPRMRSGGERPWHAGLLSRRDPALGEALMSALRRADPSLNLAANVPYTIEDESDYTIPLHAETRGLPHALLEIRNDLIAAPQGQVRWAALLADAMRQVAAETTAGAA